MTNDEGRMAPNSAEHSIMLVIPSLSRDLTFLLWITLFEMVCRSRCG
jgi:hypothetical protein